MSNSEPARPIGVLVNGFARSWTCAGSPPARWAPWRYRGPWIGDIAAADPALSGVDLDYFAYDTRLFNWNPLRKIPPIGQLGEQFKTWIHAKGYHRRPTTLIGHSQGGLVILSYLAVMLGNREASLLEYLRQVILIATPQKGSTLLFTARNLVGRIFRNVQEERMRVLNESVDAMLATITRDIINADRESDHSWPVPIRAFYGTEDRVVPRESARGELDTSAVDALPGDHFCVLRPTSSADPRYAAIRNAILQPIGHKRVFSIEHYRTSITVIPERRLEENNFRNRERRINAVSVGWVNRSVRFAEGNLCEDQFSIRYRTSAPDGYIKDRKATPEWAVITAATAGEYEDEGRQFRASVRPGKRRHDECSLDLVVVNGFNPGSTHAHFHLRPPDEPLRIIECLSYSIDLSAYRGAGWEITEMELYLHPREPSICDHLCHSRVAHHRQEPSSSDPSHGVWHWNLYSVRGGVIDIFWALGSTSSCSGLAGDALTLRRPP
jgi:pimeloyl-ACP methyl ester carboxylesterase